MSETSAFLLQWRIKPLAKNSYSWASVSTGRRGCGWADQTWQTWLLKKAWPVSVLSLCGNALPCCSLAISQIQRQTLNVLVWTRWKLWIFVDKSDISNFICFNLREKEYRSSHCDAAEMNPTNIHKDVALQSKKKKKNIEFIQCPVYAQDRIPSFPPPSFLPSLLSFFLPSLECIFHPIVWFDTVILF